RHMTEIHIRPATADDKPAVVEFTQHTWPDGDYIPEVYDIWLVDPRGPLLVAEEGGKVVAIGKVTFLGPRQAWLEGMRVHPEHRRHGIGRRFLAYQTTLAREKGAQVVRLATAYNNYPVHKIVAEQGMSHIASFTPIIADAETGPVRARVLAPAELDEAWAVVVTGDVHRRGARLYDLGWVWKELDQEEVARSIQEGNALGWQPQRDSGPLAGLALLPYDWYDKDALRAGWVGGDLAEMAEFAHDLRRVAAARGFQKVYTMLVDLPDLRAAFTAAGYKPDSGDEAFTLWVFKKDL
ncbi:MAG: GNAT family N-acetyltransferase, partial [Anaerolineae bacterium]|nr:GNAT family N-acetyltransferase [Anaerolineae bacterium]